MSEVTPHCPTCGDQVFRKAKTGPVPTYCSSTCRRKIGSRRSLDQQARARIEARAAGKYRCEECGVMLLGRETKLCRTHAQRSSTPDNLARTCNEVDCDRPVRALGVCSMHHKRILRSQGRFAVYPRTDKKRDSDHRRRALLHGARTGGSVFLSDILDRDGTGCGLCGDPVDLALSYPNPYSKSVDHIIPLSRGGAHEASNCQLAHLRCNISKGAKVA